MMMEKSYENALLNGIKKKRKNENNQMMEAMPVELLK